MTVQLTRRRALQLAALGAASAAAGGVGLWRSAAPRGELAVTDGGGDLRVPEILASEDGLLEVNLEAAAGVRLAGQDTSALGYNGTSPGPTWRLRPGDLLRVAVANRLDAPTNLHVHGLHVSPEGNSDNVFIEVLPGETFHYEYRLPDDHPTGTFWYHPHRHGLVADQVFGGLAGTIIVASDEAEAAFDEDRVLVVTDITLDAEGRVVRPSFQQRMMGREGRLVLVNGQFQPTLTGRRGARERWRVVNACTSRFLRLRLEDAELTVLGLDGHRVRPARQEDVLLAPGNRADLAVEAAAEGRYRLLAEPYDRGGMGMGPMMRGEQTASEPVPLAVLDVSAEAVSAPPLRWEAAQVEDLRAVAVDARRELRFEVGMGGGGMRFLIDGREFDPDRVDTEVRMGAVEEWVLRNPSPMDHPFHLHVWPIQVLDKGTGPVSEPQWRDVINIPAGRAVRVRVRFADFGGRTVYHCHILDHEDQGMMGIVVAS